MSVTIQDLLEGPEGTSLVVRLLPDNPRPITQATLVEDVGLGEALRPGAVAVLSRAAADAANGYRLDVLVRDAVAREVAVLILRSATRRSITAESLARRGDLALLEVGEEADPIQVLDWVGAVVSGDSRAVVARLAGAVAYEPSRTDDLAAIVDEVARMSGVAMQHVDDERGATIVVDGVLCGSVVTQEEGPAGVLACRIAAGIASRVLTERDRAVTMPIRTASSALNQLLLCSTTNLAAVAQRAGEAGLDVDGWHCAVRLSVDGDGSTENAVAALERDVMDAIAHRGRIPGAAWTVARPDSSLVLVRTTRSTPRRTVAMDQLLVDEVLGAVVERHPRLRFRVGVATPHDGPGGLRTSAEEARIALASARLGDDRLSIATFDALGLRRMLAEWLTTDTARDTVRDLLAPLDALGPDKAAVAIETLHAYLDERGSLKRAAARLNVHRNAVVYRMAQVSAQLQVDLDDPDERFALQLACRARLMTGPSDVRP